jgi:hypothetical protein
VQRLLRRAALSIDGGAGHALGQTLRREHAVARDVRGLRADLIDAAEDHVLDQVRIDRGPRDQLVEHQRAEIDRMPLRELAAAPATGRADCADDVCLSHEQDLLIQMRCGRCVALTANRGAAAPT